MTDAYYLQNRIQLEINNLRRGHVYYSIDEQPEVCARLIAPLFDKGPEPVDADLPMDEQFKVVRGECLNYGSFNTAKQMLRDAILGHRVSVTVQSWDDVPAAIGLIRERQREFKKGIR